jgi:uncharacterized protein (TIGR03067 family)
MRKLLPAVCVVLLLGADKADDAKKLKGKWVIKSVERGGKTADLATEEHAPKSITFKDGKVTVEMKEGEPHKGDFKVGKEDKLGTLDLIPDDPARKDNGVKALYKVDGDTLTICVNEGKISERPKELGAKEGSHCAVIVFTREKK